MGASRQLEQDLATLGLGDWYTALAPLIAGRLDDAAHGDMPRWRAAIEALPAVTPGGAVLDADTVRLLGSDLPLAQQAIVRECLLQLLPWRKGPFDVGGVVIDSEWRSDLKWRRVRDAIQPLAGRHVLDVGCGNGYYALRMLGSGAACVIGVDPTLQYVMQFQALRHFLPPLPAHVLPLRSQELPPASAAFDTVFSMGVLYHQRSPIDHLRDLCGQLKKGGELLLETLVLPGKGAYARTPPERYARMRNVWLLPSVAELTTWLERSGYTATRCADLSRTDCDEQRSTPWMPFESLREALDPDDASLTVEGWPAPRRALLVARKA